MYQIEAECFTKGRPAQCALSIVGRRGWRAFLRVVSITPFIHFGRLSGWASGNDLSGPFIIPFTIEC